MSKPEPGDIVKNAKVAFLDPHGRHWVRDGNLRGYVLSTNMKKHDVMTNDREEKTIPHLVCLSRDEFSPRDYEHRLCRQFYDNNGNPFQNKTKIWRDRWRQAASKPAGIRCIPPDQPEKMPSPPGNRKWRFVQSSDWVMPAFTSIYSDAIKGENVFSPTPLDDEQSLPPVYNRNLYGGESAGFAPLKFSGTLTGGKIKGAKQAIVYLHGTLDPLKWHTDLRRHVLSAAGKNPEETKLWHIWMKEKLPKGSELYDIFRECKYNSGKDMCMPCSADRFRDIHEKLSAVSQKYWEKAVTFWESNATKIMETQSQPDGITRFTATVFSKMSFFVNGKNIIRYPLLIMKGWSYEPLDKQDKAIIHLNVVTFYFKKKSPDPLNRNTRPNMEMSNVSRI